MKHVEERIQACLDGELEAAEARAVRDHCRRCDRCGRVWEEIETVGRALAADRDDESGASLWPDVRARLAPPARRRWVFAMTAGAAAAAGLAAGVLIGAPASEPGAETAWQSTTLAAQSLLDDTYATTLDEVYWGTAYDESEVTP